ncbi:MULTISPECIES: peptidoglycan-binding domain-containing protein [unclassified Sulfitobacter]|uniref:peptidoglycan-binding domain-containing protein n=1 Tax=unclassified Sulfitobacter TaxID=196795 RepID=UPI0007C20E7A|nr:MULTISPECIES: peptidoglycan-binding domain-containing protein [unclassified Sulfitobacter]KZX96939.1 peptidoglycan-binding protein [Sulfitobacter sp. HI0027]KZX98092.1 peptidoglycan-binding protein [Sulfitobacter sp. HI0021]KZY98931.1 peptidoglycan-binding protein [Sulfitobacter sp. HI0076]
MTQPPPLRSTLQRAALLLLVAGIAGCETATPATPRPEPGVLEATRNGPASAAEGSCWGRTVSPAVIETVTEQVEVTPAKMNADGSIAKPPVYKTETRQEIVRARVDNWFETPCPDVLTSEFNSTLQRALQARGFYAGPITGEMDRATRLAVRRYQAKQGPNSEVLSLTTARALGLVAVPRQGG